VVLLRGLLIVAVGALMLQPGKLASGLGGVALLAVYAVSNAALIFVPTRYVQMFRFELVVGSVDLLLVALGMHFAGASSTALPVSAALMVLVVAMGNYRAHTVAGAAAVGALHSWLVLGDGRGPALAWQLALQVLFLCSVALYYGHLASGIHASMRQDEDESLERKELTTLVEILDAVTSSLDVNKVARTIVQKITDVIPAMRCSMLFVNEDRTRAFVMASHDDPTIDMLEIDLQKYPEIRCAIETRDPVLIRDVKQDPMMASVRQVLEQLQFESIMVVPMTFANDVLGTLCLKTARTGKTFSPAEVKFCTAVARASANALKNALLYRQVRDEAERNLEISQKLASVLDQSPDLIVTTDCEGLITEFNRGAELLTGRRRADMVGRSSESLLGVDGSQWIETIRSERRIEAHAISLNKADGSELNLELNMAALSDEAGNVNGTVWVGRDVSELKSAQLQLLQAKKLSSIGEVISGVAHELNNPLSGVLGYSQLLLSKKEAVGSANELMRIHESALRCQKIVKNLLSFARVHKPERVYLGLNGIVEKSIELRRYQLEVHNVEVIKNLDTELPRTMLDFHQIQQVLVNLINNAHQAIAATQRQSGRLEVRTWHDSHNVMLEVRDDGVGMDHTTLERIFDPFFTTKEQGQGTGLGLSVSYGIVREHGGKIYAKSRVGEGTTFLIEIPIHGEADDDLPIERPVAIDGPAREVAGKRVLVVDDEPMIVDLLVEILRGASFQIDTAANGAEAARKVAKSRYDVIVSDVRMPQMNGMQMYRKLLETRPELAGRVLFVTGDLIDPETAEFVRKVDAPTIAKPLDIHEVVNAVKAIAERAEAPQPVG
jgi:two-component system NtrC family sensor kinase